MLAFLDVVPDFCRLLSALLGSDNAVAAGDPESALLGVKLCDTDLHCLADVRIKILNFAVLDLCSVDIYVDTLESTDETVLDGACDLNFDGSLAVESLFDLGSALLSLYIVLGKDDLLALI